MKSRTLTHKRVRQLKVHSVLILIGCIIFILVYVIPDIKGIRWIPLTINAILQVTNLIWLFRTRFIYNPTSYPIIVVDDTCVHLRYSLRFYTVQLSLMGSSETVIEAKVTLGWRDRLIDRLMNETNDLIVFNIFKSHLSEVKVKSADIVFFWMDSNDDCGSNNQLTALLDGKFGNPEKKILLIGCQPDPTYYDEVRFDVETYNTKHKRRLRLYSDFNQMQDRLITILND